MVKSFNRVNADYVNPMDITLRVRSENVVENVLPADNAQKCSKTPIVADRRFTADFSQNEVAGFDRSITSSFLNMVPS
ncbi:hypothetical protein GCM10011332_31560 [Terasakiella brassicae]|uniref:Uncharacterized protein n=1 Tax=Terasakiella brassicae TaxID=1634917 RepID=A0A917FH09_9PROT|nr:hypothetical protein [Terasakiella brassicae]GGF75239.1 hypothetical protein GCM10011332_31560 [Terasakiella brassicae]